MAGIPERMSDRHSESPRKRVERQIANILIAQALVEDIPDEKWIPGLDSWAALCDDPSIFLKKIERYDREEAGCEHDDVPEKVLLNQCGTAACFGGWVAVHPYFKRQGVNRSNDGAPFYGWRTAAGEIDFDKEWASASAVARDLFGDEDIFDSMGGDYAHSPKKVVKGRLKTALADRLQEQADLLVTA